MREGKLFPVGIDFEYCSGAPVVHRPDAGLAAAREDILPGDELIAIDGKPVDGDEPLRAGDDAGRTEGQARRRWCSSASGRTAVDRTADPRACKREKLDEIVGGADGVHARRRRTGYARLTSFSNGQSPTTSTRR